MPPGHCVLWRMPCRAMVQRILFTTRVPMLGCIAAGAPASCLTTDQREDDMAESVYKVIELIGTSKESWEKAAAAAVSRAGKSLARPPCRRGRQARSATGRQGRGRGVPRQGERLVQVRGLAAILRRQCERSANASPCSPVTGIRRTGQCFACSPLTEVALARREVVTAPAARSRRR